MHDQSGLFSETSHDGPSGLRFVPGFLSQAEAEALLELVATLTLAEARYKDYTAKRRVASFGGQFDYAALQLRDGPPIPEAFTPLIAKVARWLGVAPGLFRHVLVADYRPGTPLGWHRDVPDFESIVGVSLLGTATMKFRPYPHIVGQRAQVLQLELPPRSLYVIEEDARWHWQHSVAATREQRYSITLRTRRGSEPLLRLGISEIMCAYAESTASAVTLGSSYSIDTTLRIHESTNPASLQRLAMMLAVGTTRDLYAARTDSPRHGHPAGRR